MEITNLMPQANNVLQYSLAHFSCLTIQVTMDYSCFFRPEQCEADGKYFWEIRSVFFFFFWEIRSKHRSETCIFFFLYHRIFTKFGSVKKDIFQSLWNNVFFCFVFVFVGFNSQSRKDFFIISEKISPVGGRGQHYRESKQHCLQ